jgi:hypothetical protein
MHKEVEMNEQLTVCRRKLWVVQTALRIRLESMDNTDQILTDNNVM